MALRGTLSDFGMGDLFQLVGTQGKTGVLLLKRRDLEVHISFVDGAVVQATSKGRGQLNLLGDLMVRAEVISPEALKAALADQERTMRPLGDLLVESRAADWATVKEFMLLQVTETIYSVFRWESGTYEFRQDGEIEYDPKLMRPIGAEAILLEAYRIVDEWDSVASHIPSREMTFEVLRALPAERADDGAAEDEDLLAGMDAMFSGDHDDDEEEEEEDDDIGRNERVVYDLIAPRRTVAKLIDLSRLGEFDTMKALVVLMRGGYVRGQVPDEALQKRPLIRWDAIATAVPAFLTRLALYAVVSAAVGGVIRLHELDETGLLARDRDLRVRDFDLTNQVGQVTEQRLRRTLELFRLIEGRYPKDLGELKAKGHTVDESALREPYQLRFAYERTEDGYRLTAPFR